MWSSPNSETMNNLFKKNCFIIYKILSVLFTLKNAYTCITTCYQDTEYFQHPRMFSHAPSQSMSIPASEATTDLISITIG